VEPDADRINKYLNDMASEMEDVKALLMRSDDELLRERLLLKSLRYSIIVLAESMASVLQHLLAKRHNVVVRGFTEVFVKAKEHRLLPDEVLDRLLPFARFRNLLVHQYWRVDDRVFLTNLRAGMDDFRAFALLVRGMAAPSQSGNQGSE
jgi:uncharacterized protein YutE (UPF0331/DUF86 family)